MLALVLLASVAVADVTYGTLYPGDMEDLDLMMALGGYDVTCQCLNQDGDINIGIVINTRWTGSTPQWEFVGYALSAIGSLTAETSWHSDYAMVVFSDYGFICSTYQARRFANNAGSWSDSQLSRWISNHLSAGYY